MYTCVATLTPLQMRYDGEHHPDAGGSRSLEEASASRRHAHEVAQMAHAPHRKRLVTVARVANVRMFAGSAQSTANARSTTFLSSA